MEAVKTYDQIVVMKQGKIVEKGIHDDLIQNYGLYTQLYFRRRKESMKMSRESLKKFMINPAQIVTLTTDTGDSPGAAHDKRLEQLEDVSGYLVRKC